MKLTFLLLCSLVLSACNGGGSGSGSGSTPSQENQQAEPANTPKPEPEPIYEDFDPLPYETKESATSYLKDQLPQIKYFDFKVRVESPGTNSNQIIVCNQGFTGLNVATEMRHVRSALNTAYGKDFYNESNRPVVFFRDINNKIQKLYASELYSMLDEVIKSDLKVWNSNPTGACKQKSFTYARNESDLKVKVDFSQYPAGTDEKLIASLEINEYMTLGANNIYLSLGSSSSVRSVVNLELCSTKGKIERPRNMLKGLSKALTNVFPKALESASNVEAQSKIPTIKIGTSQVFVNDLNLVIKYALEDIESGQVDCSKEHVINIERECSEGSCESFSTFPRGIPEGTPEYLLASLDRNNFEVLQSIYINIPKKVNPETTTILLTSCSTLEESKPDLEKVLEALTKVYPEDQLVVARNLKHQAEFPTIKFDNKDIYVNDLKQTFTRALEGLVKGEFNCKDTEPSFTRDCDDAKCELKMKL